MFDFGENNPHYILNRTIGQFLTYSGRCKETNFNTPASVWDKNSRTPDNTAYIFFITLSISNQNHSDSIS
jgi:hypothetical protein